MDYYGFCASEQSAVSGGDYHCDCLLYAAVYRLGHKYCVSFVDFGFAAAYEYVLLNFDVLSADVNGVSDPGGMVCGRDQKECVFQSVFCFLVSGRSELV